MRPEDLSDHEILTIRRERELLRYHVREAEIALEEYLSGPHGESRQDYENQVRALRQDVFANRSEMKILDDHLAIVDTKTPIKAPKWVKIGNIKDLAGIEIEASKPSHPPILAEALTRIVTKPKLVERVLGSRAEQFQAQVKKRGVLAAQIFYWSDSVASAWPAFKQLFRWAIIGDFVRRFLGS